MNFNMNVNLTECDVCYGRGNGIMNLTGNKRFRELLRVYSPKYKDPYRTNKEKDDITTEVIRIVQSYGGRFFQFKDGICVQMVSKRMIRKKVKDSLRNCKKDEIQVLDGDDDINTRIGTRTPCQKLVSDGRQEQRNSQQAEKVINLEQEESQEEVHVQLDDLIKWGFLSDEDESRSPVRRTMLEEEKISDIETFMDA